MAEGLLGQKSLLVFGVLLAWLLLFHLLVNIWLLCMFTSLLVVLGGWLGSHAVLESNSVIHLERFIALEQMPPSVEDEEHLDQEIHRTVRKIIRDFVSSWFSTVSTERDFESQVHDAMISTAMELKLRARQVDRKKLTQRILELLGCHLQDYFAARDIEARERRSGAALRRRPLWSTYSALTTPHVATTSDEVEVNYLRAVVDVLLHVLVPPPHLETRTGKFVVVELIICNVLLPLVAKLSDPDWLNLLVIEILSKGCSVHMAPPAALPASPPDPPPAPPTGSGFTPAHPPGTESPQQAEPKTLSNTEPSQLHEEVDSSHRSTGDRSGTTFSAGNVGNIKSYPSFHQNDSDAESPPVDLKQSSIDSFVVIGRDEGLFERRPIMGNDGADLEEEPSPSPVDDLCPKVLVNVEMGEQAKLCGETESRDGSSAELTSRELVLGGHQTGSSTELIAASPLQGCSSMGTFSFEPLSSPEGPVIIQNLRITGTITAKEHRGTGSHPYTLYTIKFHSDTLSRTPVSWNTHCTGPYETSVGGENTGSVQLSSEEAEVMSVCLSPVQPVAYHMVNRRYSEFLNLQTRLEEKAELRKLSKGVKGPKKILPDMPFWNMDSDKIEARKGLLETFLKQLCAIPEIANSEEMQEFLALNTDARIAFVKKPFIVSRIDKIVVNAIVDTLKTAFPRSEPQSPTEDEAEVDGRLVFDKKSKSRVKSSGRNVPVLNGSDIRQPVVFSVDQTNSVFKGMSLEELQAAISEQERVSMEVAAESEEHVGPLRDTQGQVRPGSETELAEVALNVLCLLMKEQWSCMCMENVQKTIRLLFGTLINRWLDVSVANLTSSRSWVSYLQLIQEAVWPGGTLPTEPAEERSNLQKNSTEQQALHCLMGLIPALASDVLGSEKYKLCWQTTLDSFQDPVINRHLVYCLLDVLLEVLLPELPEKDFQRRLLKTLSGNPEKTLA